MDLELLKHAKNYIEKMANGINPLTGEVVPDNDTLNNIRISRCLFFVNDILKEVLLNGGIVNPKTKKIPFNLTLESLNKIDYNENLSISRFVKKINDLKMNENMEKLKAVDVCKWLVSIGLLEEKEINNKKVKVPTEVGRNVGMYLEHRFAQYGEYDIVLYKREAQEFIISNFDSLLDYLNNI